LRLSAPIVIGIELSGLKGKIASALKKIKNQRRSRSVWSFDRNFETERADRESFVPIFSELKKNFTPAAEHSQKLTPDAATILSLLRARRKKSKADLADLELILEILQS
jgi:ABC-type transporter Mla subunit MlaD